MKDVIGVHEAEPETQRTDFVPFHPVVLPVVEEKPEDDGDRLLPMSSLFFFIVLSVPPHEDKWTLVTDTG